MSVACQEKLDMLDCSEAFKTCLSEEEVKGMDDDEGEFFENVATSVRRLVPEFDFDESCDSDGRPKEGVVVLRDGDSKEEEEEEFAVDIVGSSG